MRTLLMILAEQLVIMFMELVLLVITLTLLQLTVLRFLIILLLVAILLILKNSGIEGAETAVVALLSVDRLLDMSRTAVNVFSDSCAAVIIAKSEGESLRV